MEKRLFGGKVFGAGRWKDKFQDVNANELRLSIESLCVCKMEVGVLWKSPEKPQ